jgi:glycosyltransferase involved in cell wall biosynthesis
MRIVIDMQGAQTESQFRGIGRYTISFSHAVARLRSEHEKVYTASTCLIAVFYSDGFGLPLIEAARHKLPIIARDIFREVAGDHTFYFKGEGPEALANGIRECLSLRDRNNHPKSDDMPWPTWKESAATLLQCFEESGG